MNSYQNIETIYFSPILLEIIEKYKGFPKFFIRMKIKKLLKMMEIN
jgi:hypothetical protein